MAEAQLETEHSIPDDEGEALTSTLPVRLLPFQGCWLTPRAAKSVTLVHTQFQPRADDILLATFPKSGTTWLKALAFTILNRLRYPITGSGQHPLLLHHPHDLVPHRDLHPVMELEAIPSPRLLCTHLPHALLPSGMSSALGCRVVYICREPKDVIVSSWHFGNKVGKDFFVEFDKLFESFCEGVTLFGPLWDQYLGYWKQSLIEPDKVLFLKYDEMMADPSKHVEMLAEFLRVPFTVEEKNAGVERKW